MAEPLFVRAGALVSARVWNAMAAAVRSLRLIKGPGVRLRWTPAGTFISFDAGTAVWLHPFKVSLVGSDGARIRPGLLNGIRPTVKDVPLDAESAPVLDLTSQKLDKDGRGWVALEATLDEHWAVKSAAVVQVASLDSDDGSAPENSTPGYSIGATFTLSGRRARHPLAMLLRRKGGRLDLYQVTHHSLAHRAAVQSAAAQGARHFFFPAG